MINMLLKERILEAQNGNQEVFLGLVCDFKPLLMKYAGLLNYSDGYEILQLKFIELIKNMPISAMRMTDDPFILSYFEKTIYRYFIFLLRRKQLSGKEVPFSALIHEDESVGSYLDFPDRFISSSDEYMHILLDFLKESLTAYEADIITYHCLMLYTNDEIARYYDVSPPAISKAKTKALKKLRKACDQLNRELGY